MTETLETYQIRGAFPPIDQNRAMSLLIQGTPQAALTTFARAFKAKQVVTSVYEREIRIKGYPYYPFRFKRHRWTNVVMGRYQEHYSRIMEITQGISASLKSKAICYLFSPTAGIMQYRLYECGMLVELMSCDASQTYPRILERREVDEIAERGTKPGFYFYSEVRQVRKTELRDRNVIAFVDDFFRREDALLYLAVEWDMKISQFRLIRGSQSDLERTDLVITQLRGLRARE